MSILFTSFIFMSLNASANVAGQWTGWAYWGFDGSETRCDAQLHFQESEQSLARTHGSFDCQVIFMEAPAILLQKNESHLMRENQVVGSWQEGSYQWTEPYSEDTRIEVYLTVQGRRMDYIETWVSSENKEIYKIKARLFGGL